MVTLGLGIVYLVMRYQHECLREKIVEKAYQMFVNIDIQKLEEVTDEMTGYEMRSLYSLQDADFRKEMCLRLKIC